MTHETAIVLFAHGARDAAWARPLERLREAVSRAQPQVAVRIAFLEMQPPGLAETLAALVADGARRIDIAPIFWSRGGHIARDLPALVADFSAQTPGVQVRVLPVLAELPGMDDFVARAIVAQAGAAQPPV